MRLYTIQPVEIYNNILANGVFHSSEQYIMDESFKDAYSWMSSMALKYKGWQVPRPIWCWVTKPDLRKHRFIKDKDQPALQDFVLLELEVPDNLPLVSEFGLWHNVLNYSPVIRNDDESVYWDAQMELLKKDPNNENIHNLIKKSWELILKDNNDKDFSQFNVDWTGTILFQAIIPFIKNEYILKSTHFKIKNKHF